MIEALLFLTALSLAQGAQQALTEPHPDCPASGHWLLPHEYDCTKFYYCIRGEKFITPTDCPENTEFSVTLQVCTHAELSGCTLPGPSNPTESSSTFTPAPTGIPDAGTTPSSIELLENGCPADSLIHMLLPHETSCQKFYYCVHGDKVLMSCGPGTVFNFDIQNCDHPYNIDRDCEEDSNENDSNISSNENNNDDSDEQDSISKEDNGSKSNEEIIESDENVSNENDSDINSNENDSNVDSNENDNGSDENDSNISSNENDSSVDNNEHDNDSNSNENDSSDESDSDSSNENDSGDEDNNDNDSHDNDDDELEILPNGCPIEWSLKQLPHEHYCSKSYQCVYGSVEEEDCPVGTHFSYEVYVTVSAKKKNPYGTLKICVMC